jgi:phage FluMu gp28-like protein
MHKIIDSDSQLSCHFMPHQIRWILAEEKLAAQHRQAIALAEKSVRIGWTYADAFKNVRKRILHPNRDYLFATKDYPSALEYVRQCYHFAEIFNLTHSIIRHGEESINVNKLDERGKPSAFTEDVRIGVIKFDNGSRIIAFSANPQAMAVYGGDVGLDEFAKHPNPKLLWETAQGRIAWGGDLAIWSSHDGEDTLFNEFAHEARAGAGPWNIYFRITMPDAVELGLVERINRAKGTSFSRAQFLADCRSRARDEEIFQQAYMCNPLGTSAASIVEWSAIERCREDYQLERVHLESDQVLRLFGQFHPDTQSTRESKIHDFLCSSFPNLFDSGAQRRPDSVHRESSSSNSSSHASRITHHISSSPNHQPSTINYRLGFDVAASGQGDLAVLYIDEVKPPVLQLRALFTTRTEDWDFLKTILFFFLKKLPRLHAAGDESGLGRQICWETASRFGSRFLKVNFASKKQDLGFILMNQLSVAEKRFPRSEQDIAADFFALRKSYTGTRWVFTESRNTFNPVSHCDIAWAGALASYAHTEAYSGASAAIILENGTILTGEQLLAAENGSEEDRVRAMLLSDDPSIWRRFG